MRIYLGGTSRPELRKARQLAPSHVFGTMWTPADTRLNYVPFAVDNGAYNGSFEPEEWVALLDRLSEYSYGPDFVVLPDKLNDAEGTLERHRVWASEVHDRHLPPAAVIQPGLPVRTQVKLADRIGAKFVFLGGDTRWQRTHGSEIVRTAHEMGLSVHIGNPSGEDGFVWAYRTGFDSADTSTVTQNDYRHYLERLEAVTQRHSKGDALKKTGRQSVLDEEFVAVADGGNTRSRDTKSRPEGQSDG